MKSKVRSKVWAGRAQSRCIITCILDDAGFTLVEVLIVSLMLATISMTTYSGLAGGVQIWKRIEASIDEVDLALGWKKFKKDLVSLVPQKEIGFVGTSGELSFPGLVTVFDTDDITHQEVGRVRYFFDAAADNLCREELTYVKAVSGAAADCKTVFSSVGNVVFKYYGVEESEETHEPISGGWYSVWDSDDFPIAIRMEITLKGAEGNGEKKKQYTATFPQRPKRDP